MGYIHASAGLKKIRHAVMLDIAAFGIIVLMAALILFIEFKKRLSGMPAEMEGTLRVIAFFMTLAPIVLILLSLFVQLRGLRLAAKDEASFKIAYILNLIVIAASGVTSFLSMRNIGTDILGSVSNVISEISQMVVMMLVFRGALNLFAKEGQTDYVKQTKTTIALIVVVYLLSTVTGVISNFFGKTGGSGLISILCQLGSAVLHLIVLNSYIGFLGEASKKLG